jgi:hypothetical protein
MGMNPDKQNVLHQRLAMVRYRLDHDITAQGLISHNEMQMIRCMHEITAILDTIVKGIP